MTRPALTRYDHILRIADRLSKVCTGNEVTDRAIYKAFGLA